MNTAVMCHLLKLGYSSSYSEFIQPASFHYRRAPSIHISRVPHLPYYFNPLTQNKLWWNMVASHPAAIICVPYAVIDGLKFRPPTMFKHQEASMSRKSGGLTRTSIR